ncbi:hypothetical protein YC2023_015940 [Brassica napus]
MLGNVLSVKGIMGMGYKIIHKKLDILPLLLILPSFLCVKWLVTNNSHSKMFNETKQKENHNELRISQSYLDDELYKLCRKTFSCGEHADVYYPLWGPGREACGHPDFKLNCSGGFAEVKISAVKFGIIYSSYYRITLRRSDYIDNLYPRNPLNVQFNENVVFFPLNTEVLTVYYDCPNFSPIRSHSSYIGELDAVNGIRNYYVTKNLTSPSLDDIRGLLNNFSEMCKRNVSIPASGSALESLQRSPSQDNLKKAIEQGFDLYVNLDCRRCTYSGGACGYNQTSSLFVCYCKDGPHTSTCQRHHGIIALVVFLCPCFRVQIFRKRKTSDERRQEMLRALIPLKHYTYAQVKKITQSFAEVVGRGGFGVDLGQGDNVSPTEYGIRSEEEEIAKKMKIVGLWCIQSSPSNRPPMNIVVEMMEGSLEALEVPPMPVLQQIPAARLSQSFWDSGEGSSASEVLSSDSSPSDCPPMRTSRQLTMEHTSTRNISQKFKNHVNNLLDPLKICREPNQNRIELKILTVFELLCSSSEYEGTTNNRFHSRRFSENKSEIQTEGAAIITPDGLLRLTDRNLNVTGTAFYRKPVRLLNHSNLNLSTKAEVCSFSTSLLFILVPSKSRNGGFGFTFTLSPTPVEFDTVQGFRDGADARGNHIGLNFNSVTSDVQEPVVYTSDEGRKEDFQYETESIRVRLDYNGSTQMLNLIVSPAKFPIAPSIPLISQRVPKLLDIVQEEMYVGFTAGDMSRNYPAGLCVFCSLIPGFFPRPESEGPFQPPLLTGDHSGAPTTDPKWTLCTLDLEISITLK